jgi:DNA-damage-inducible protein D
MTTGQSPDFDSIKQTNVYGADYWSARDLMPLLGYGKNWHNFIKSIEKAQTSLVQDGQRVEDHIYESVKMITIGKGGQREVTDFLLSKRACHLIAMNGDPKKAEIAAAQSYFAFAAEYLDMHQARLEQEQRLEIRLKVSESYKQLGEAAHQAGVQSETFGIFIDAGYLGLHRHTLQELKEKKNIPDKEDYLDNITRAELSAIDFKNNLTEGRLITENITGLDDASQAHYFVGDQVRKTIEAVGRPYPEDLPPAASIRKMVEERRRASKKRKLQATDQDQSLRLFDDSEDTV